MKSYRGSRGTAPFILNLGTRWRRVFYLGMPRPLLREKNLLNGRLGGSQSQCGRFGEVFSSDILRIFTDF